MVPSSWRNTPPGGPFPLASDNWLIEILVKSLEELSALQTVEPQELRGALTKWMQGASESDIEEVHPDAWEALTPRQLETMIPWALTGAFEVIAALAGRPQLRETAHERLDPVRIRDGIPDSALSELVREGADRVRVSRIAAEHSEPTANHWFVQQSVRDFVKERLEAEEEASAAAEDERAPVEGLD